MRGGVHGGRGRRRVSEERVVEILPQLAGERGLHPARLLSGSQWWNLDVRFDAIVEGVGLAAVLPVAIEEEGETDAATADYSG